MHRVYPIWCSVSCICKRCLAKDELYFQHREIIWPDDVLFAKSDG